MNRSPARPGARRGAAVALSLCAVAVVAVMTLPFESRAQLPQAGGAAARTPVVSLTGPSTTWAELTSRQHAALAPLQHGWNQIAPEHQQKWIEIAARLPSMSLQEQGRIQERMTEWAQMSPQDRGRARLRFQEAKRLQSTDRQARWEEFQALTPEQRHALAERAAQASAPRAAQPSTSGEAQVKKTAEASTSADHKAAPVTSARADAPGKAASAREQVREQRRVVKEEAIAPAMVQAKPGVTTTLMSRRSLASQHPKPATPHIATASSVIDSSTLLPRRPVAPARAHPAETERDALPSSQPPAPAMPAPAVSPQQAMEMPHPEFYK